MQPKPTLTSLAWRVGPLTLLLVLVAAVIVVSASGAPAPAVAAPNAQRAEAQKEPAAVEPAAAVLKLPASAPLPATAAAAAPDSVTETIQGAVVTQVFTLHEGWNAVYLGVEPINPSGLVDPSKPELGYKKPLLDAVFDGLAGLESVWTYNQPPTHKDYIVDPGEGLWDAPGWDRYLPVANRGPDGRSREFLSTLTNLHANTGYLIKMQAGTNGTFRVSGKPVPGHHRWRAGAYNLAGFPLTASGATVATFLTGSPVLEVRGLTVDGSWTAPLVGTDTLQSSVAYLVRYAEEPPEGQPATPDFASPLDISNPPAEGLSFQAGAVGQVKTLVVRNASDKAATVTLRLPPGAGTAVALNYTGDGTTTVDLRSASPSFVLQPGDGRQLTLRVPVADQPAAGETLFEVLSPELGALWRFPVAAEPGSYAGLWVGEVLVNNVSEARLGAADFDSDLTVSLGSLNDSGVHGSIQIHDTVAGTVDTSTFTVTLTLPDLTVETVSPSSPNSLYVRGQAFVDQNQNGQKDPSEPGLAGVEVAVGNNSRTTAVDGSYVAGGLTPGDYPLSAGGSVVEGYTTAFPIVVPPTSANAAPVTVQNTTPAGITLGSDGATAVTPSGYLTQVIGQERLPYYDAYDNRAEPPLNFGYVRQDYAAVYGGTCDARTEKLFDLGWVKNGSLVLSLAGRSLSELTGTPTHVLISWKGQPVACANLVVGAPTMFADGRGSQAQFRVILRVADSKQVGLLPYYVITDTQRLSSVVFLSMQQPITTTGPFGDLATPLEYNLTLPANDPLNPYKHKYHPDHDNLDAKFDKPQEESFGISRKVTFILTALPPNGTEADAKALDWGGSVWGGEYREVVEGLHQNSITARGYFVIRHVLPTSELDKQEYDR